ncbi:hypothetical protein COL27_29720, partial [Bacillus sp. AFS075960]
TRSRDEELRGTAAAAAGSAASTRPVRRDSESWVPVGSKPTENAMVRNGKVSGQGISKEFHAAALTVVVGCLPLDAICL